MTVTAPSIRLLDWLRLLLVLLLFAIVVGVIAYAVYVAFWQRPCAACVGSFVSEYQCDALDLTLIEEMQSPGDIDMLFLSGGGFRGAYGAGVLNGWSAAAGSHQRSSFALVAAVSTGALQATHAFLGAEYDLGVYQDFTQHDSDDLLSFNWFDFLWSDSLAEFDGLADVLESSFTNSVIDKVALEHGKRVLCVGTVNIDTGRFVGWNMTAIAADTSNPDRYDRYRKTLLASASIPVLGPPVEIDGALHVDGGVRNNVFSGGLIENIAAVRSARQDRVYFLINQKMSVEPRCVRPHIGPLAVRSLSLLLNETIVADLDQVSVDLVKGEYQPKLCYRHIPHSYVLTDNRSGVLDAEQRCQLFCRGQRDGVNGNWLAQTENTSVAVSCTGSAYEPAETLICADGVQPVCPEIVATVSDQCD